jgi:hypothetical protein
VDAHKTELSFKGFLMFRMTKSPAANILKNSNSQDTRTKQIPIIMIQKPINRLIIGAWFLVIVW